MDAKQIDNAIETLKHGSHNQLTHGRRGGTNSNPPIPRKKRPMDTGSIVSAASEVGMLGGLAKEAIAKKNYAKANKYIRRAVSLLDDYDSQFREAGIPRPGWIEQGVQTIAGYGLQLPGKYLD